MDIASPHCRRARHLGLALLVSLVLALVIAVPRDAEACMWTPPPPFCAKTVVLSYAVPSTLLFPAGGGTFDVESLVYFGLWDFPPGTGLCPGGPYTVDVAYTLTCSVGGPGAGSAFGLPLVIGYNSFSVPVTVPDGPPRLCSLVGTATIALADGMSIVAAPPSTAVCIAEPAPGAPNLPRIDMALIAGDPLAAVHPGDQAGHLFRLTNNDPSESYTGVLTVEMVNTSKMPGASGPMPPGTGPFSISDPGPGDVFPIGFADDLFRGCLPLPPDPMLATGEPLIEPILLPPGGFLDIDVFSRPWGMCKNGSCGQASLVLDGTFADASDGLACGGFVTAADIAAPPQYLWPDSGQVAQLPPPPNPQLGIATMIAEGLPGEPVALDIPLLQPQLLIDDLPSPAQSALFSHPFVDGDHGRTQLQFFDPGQPVMNIDSFFDIFYEIEIVPQPTAPFETEIIELQLIGAPTGFEQTAPAGQARVAILPPGGVPDSFFDITFELSGVGIDEGGERRDLLFDVVELSPLSIDRFAVHLAGTVAPGPGSEIEALEVVVDFHGFAFAEPSPLIFEDGFESGDVSAWSLSVP